MKQYLDQIKEIYASLGSTQRITIGVVLSISLLVLGGVVYWANSESYETVFASNDLSKVRAAADALEKEGIPFEISEDGTQLVSPSNNLGRARIVTAGTGSITGMEVLGAIQLGSSPQHERWVYLNALQGELTRTINSLDEVAASRIHIVEPERSPFLNRANNATASITVRLHPGQTLNGSQIKGITSLVAGAVKGLAQSKVVLIDETGKLLSGPADDSPEGLASSNLVETRQHHEARYRQTILNHLGQILGSTQNVSVAVTVDVVSESKETSTQSLDPNTQVTISEKINESASKEATPGGIPGAESNLPEQTPTDDANAQEKFQSATNYEYTRSVETTTEPPGTPKRVSVSVMVNTIALDELVNASNGSITAEDLKKQVEQAVQSSIGYDKSRGDIATVSFIPFSVIESSGLTPESIDWQIYLPYVLMLLALMLFFFVLVRPIVNSITTAVRSTGKKNALLQNLSPDELAALGHVGDDPNLALAHRLRGMVDNFETIDSKDLNRLVELHDQPSAEVLRRWIRAM